MSISAMKQALKALDISHAMLNQWTNSRSVVFEAYKALEKALAEAEDAVAAEREACAKVCEDLIGTRAMARHCADAIRARGDASDISQERVDETVKDRHELAGTIPISNGGIATRTPSSFISPPKREWVGLSDKEVKKIVDKNTSDIWCNGKGVARDVEAKLKEKNT